MAAQLWILHQYSRSLRLLVARTLATLRLEQPPSVPRPFSQQCCVDTGMELAVAVTHLQQQRHARVHGGGGGLVAIGDAAGAQREQLLGALPACGHQQSNACAAGSVAIGR